MPARVGLHSRRPPALAAGLHDHKPPRSAAFCEPFGQTKLATSGFAKKGFQKRLFPYPRTKSSLSEAVLALNDGRSLAKISEALGTQGFVTRKGKPFSGSAVKSMLVQAGANLQSRAAARGRRARAPRP